MEEKISEAIKAAIEAAPERKFVESVDISFTIKDVDLKNPTNRIKEEIRLPPVVVENSRSLCLLPAKRHQGQGRRSDRVFSSDIEDFGGKKGQAKKVANEYDFFLSEVPHMGLIGRYLGVVLGPRGKMPRPVPPTLDPAVLAAGLSSTVVVKSGDKMTFHASFGTVKQSHDELLANAMEVYNRVTSKLERGIGNIRSLFIKTSMGPSQRIEVIN